MIPATETAAPIGQFAGDFCAEFFRALGPTTNGFVVAFISAGALLALGAVYAFLIKERTPPLPPTY